MSLTSSLQKIDHLFRDICCRGDSEIWHNSELRQYYWDLSIDVGFDELFVLLSDELGENKQ